MSNNSVQSTAHKLPQFLNYIHWSILSGSSVRGPLTFGLESQSESRIKSSRFA